MARQKAGVGPLQTAQVIFMIDPATAGRVEAWRVKRGITIKSEQFREIFLAGLAVLQPKWEEAYGAPSTRAINKAIKAAPSGRKPKTDVAISVGPVNDAIKRARPRKRVADGTAAA